MTVTEAREIAKDFVRTMNPEMRTDAYPNYGIYKVSLDGGAFLEMYFVQVNTGRQSQSRFYTGVDCVIENDSVRYAEIETMMDYGKIAAAILKATRIPMTIWKDTTHQYSDAECEKELACTMEFPVEIVYGFYKEKQTSFLKWLNEYTIPDVDGLYEYAVNHGFNAIRTDRKEYDT